MVRVTKPTKLSPSGEKILLRVDDSPNASIQGKTFKGVFVEINKYGAGVIKLDDVIEMGRKLNVIFVQPRHKGFGFQSLFSAFIAVYMSTENDFAHDENIFGIASLQLEK